MEPRTILDALGGYRAVAERLNLSPVRVHNWTRRGIPSALWPDVVQIAGERQRPDITFDVLRNSRAAERAA